MATMKRRHSAAARRLKNFASHLGIEGLEEGNFPMNGETTGGFWGIQEEISTNACTNNLHWERHLSAQDTSMAVSPNACVNEATTSKKISITSHVLDTNVGRPAVNIKVTLERKLSGPSSNESVWEALASGKTDADGRIRTFPSLPSLGTYRVTFFTGDYFQSKGMETPFYKSVTIEFEVHNFEHYHIPLLLAPHGYSTYRGS
eukprot:TRINITY_DN43_c0_g1_i1.p1 TRINITY_DN43_c0_g1~~TRINITY_DN43_c0_g1_i1.p1  ORF type:complete len:203 (-),score=20.62 TRINITY_DN43_c0_g1_i1:274-882(-)